jgi:hypothetical protein
VHEVDSSQIRLAVTVHVLDRLRERLPEHLGYMQNWDNTALRHEILSSWKNAYASNTPLEKWWENVDGLPRVNVLLPLPTLGDLVAIVRDDRDIPNERVMITVLTPQMVENNKYSGRWSKTREDLGKPVPLANPALADALRSKAGSLIEASQQKSQDVMVTWYDSEGDYCERRVISEAAANLIKRLVLDGVKEDTIELWVRKPLHIKKTLVVDVEI